MNEPPEKDALIIEFEKERSIRRTMRVLKAKRSQIREDLIQLITHLSMLIPLKKFASTTKASDVDILMEALQRLDDDVFTQLLLQVLQELK
ncbi:hypothetical protein Sta7437_0686 [Stanieria cyanosphaera PCC 7437]|uniref:Uncharacterized protein n=1 Tax=Stanieria cyanosphaera (strain ATCC 29371 / PCC 7437) TaxID=111780 RepID=K9XQF0_STAC7|nr:hypothetical protein [Stanieria cyanosphaera]AFZ34281.1 hypothetical protein Sta7437_0686 [Stanieria cyanosphaera PCC 7437]